MNRKRQGTTEVDPVVGELQLIKKANDSTNDLLRDILIVHLGTAGVPQLTIREIVGGGIDRVNRVAKHLKKIK